MYFLLKKPKWLEFVKEVYDPNYHKASRKQVRQTKTQTNARIIRLKDGRLFLNLGDELYFLKNVPLQVPLVMIEKGDDFFRSKCKVEGKCFINEYKKE